MTSDFTALRAELRQLEDRAAETAARLQAAEQQEISAQSGDGTITVRAAGGRLVAVDLAPEADGLPHAELVAALEDVTRRALSDSARALAQVAAEIGAQQ